LYISRVASVTRERWEEAQEAERDYWAHVGFPQFRANLEGAMRTAEWVQPHIEPPAGAWLAVGLGPLGISCTHFLRGDEELVAVDPIEPIDAEQWQLPEPCKAILRSFQQTTDRHIGRGESIEFADRSFSVVSIENTLDHVEEPGTVLAEARRVLRPGGYLLLTIDTFSSFGEARYRLIESRRLQDTTFVRAHPHRFSSEAVVDLAAGAGFTIAAAELPSRWRALTGRHFRTRLIGVAP
jgi:SAM-dependent methyltransferase